MIVDLHSHIIPGVDDGPDSVEEALRMAKQAVQSGITHMVATPHYHPQDRIPTEEIRWCFEHLKEVLHYEQIPLKLSLAMELFADWSLPELLEKKLVWTYPDSNWFLVEFAIDEEPTYMDALLQRCAQAGYRPLVAHPERYHALWREPGIAKYWLDEGYGIQVNRDSLTGKLGGRSWECASFLARMGWISCVASDAHSSRYRNADWEDAFRSFRKEYGFCAMGQWLETTPDLILNNKK